MNERIRELEKQCWDNQTNHLDTEKFAQLIVAECALLCISRPGPGDDLRSREHCAEQIRDHFGVK